MSIDSKTLKELTEIQIGVGRSKYIFGRHWRALYNVLSENEENLTEEMFIEGLKRCKFKDPEKVGLISFLCPILCVEITDRVMGNIMKELYKFILYAWYTLFIINIIQSLIEWRMLSSIPLMILCMVVTSWSFRDRSRDYNRLELIFHTLDVTGKIDRVLRKRQEQE